MCDVLAVPCLCAFGFKSLMEFYVGREEARL